MIRRKKTIQKGVYGGVPRYSGDRFRSYVLSVMSRTRFLCATPLYSLTGNRTPISRVTGADTDHYTMRDLQKKMAPPRGIEPRPYGWKPYILTTRLWGKAFCADIIVFARTKIKVWVAEYCCVMSKKKLPPTGLEPVTLGLKVRCSTDWAKGALWTMIIHWYWNYWVPFFIRSARQWLSPPRESNPPVSIGSQKEFGCICCMHSKLVS